MDWSDIIDAAHAATEKHGIAMRGRKYLQVQHRVEMFRLNFGDYGVETELLHFGKVKGESIVVQAIIKNPDGRIVASGIAEEIRGQGAVNTTSAIENAETSAIGRALACLGLHGGEFASLNEMERATDKDVERNAREAQEPEPFNSAATRDRIKAAIEKTQDAQALQALWDNHHTKEAFGQLDDDHKQELQQAYTAALYRMKGGEDAAA